MLEAKAWADSVPRHLLAVSDGSVFLWGSGAGDWRMCRCVGEEL